MQIKKMKNYFEELPNIQGTPFYLFILSIANVLANHIYIFGLRFYSDDWVQLTFIKSIDISSGLHNERPIMYLLLQIQGYFFQMNPLYYHITSLVTTTIFLFILFFVIKKIAQDNNVYSNLFPFLVTLFFCLLFNKDEAYAWPTTSLANNCAFIFFILSFLFFLYIDKKFFLFLSVFFYTMGIFTYELGIALPIFYAGYLYSTNKRMIISLWYIPPLLFYLICRSFHLFGFGTIGLNRGFGLITSDIVVKIILSPFSALYVHFLKIVYGIFGLMAMNFFHLLIIIVMDMGFIYLMSRIVLKCEDWHNNSSKMKRITILSILLILVFELPLIMHGNYFFSGGSRLYYLIDIGISLFFISFFFFFYNSTNQKVFFLIVIGLFLVINQGLYYNWEISGNLQNNIDNYIQTNYKEIMSYDFCYFNSNSFYEKIPNRLVLANFPEFNIFSHSLLIFSPLINISQILSLEDITYKFPDIRGYTQYYNARCLDTWALNEILNYYAPNSNRIVLYTNFPEMNNYIIDENDASFTFFDKRNQTNKKINKENVFEINYSSVFWEITNTLDSDFI